MSLSNTKVIYGANKTPLNLKDYNFTLSKYNWCFGHMEKDILSMSSLVLRCKDHLIDCLNTNENHGLAYKEKTSREEPITLLLFLNSSYTLENLKLGISNMLNPIEKQYKWKPTTIEFVDTYEYKAIFELQNKFNVYKVTASKMWKRNGFLFSIWASLLRICNNYPQLTKDTFIEFCNNNPHSTCNEESYINQNIISLGLTYYKNRWNYTLNNLHKFKDLHTKSVHKHEAFKGHGTDGIFWCFSLKATYRSYPNHYQQALESHPYAELVLGQQNDLRKAA